MIPRERWKRVVSLDELHAGLVVRVNPCLTCNGGKHRYLLLREFKHTGLAHTGPTPSSSTERIVGEQVWTTAEGIICPIRVPAAAIRFACTIARGGLQKLVIDESNEVDADRHERVELRR